MASWLRGIEAKTGTLERELGPQVTPAQGKRVVESLVATAISDTESVVTTLHAVGIPEVKDGKQISNLVVSSFEWISNYLAGLHSEIAALPTNNPAAFRAQAKKIREQVREAPVRGLVRGTGFSGDAKLRRAAAKSQACDHLARA
jgi:hypothetical protein